MVSINQVDKASLHVVADAVLVATCSTAYETVCLLVRSFRAELSQDLQGEHHGSTYLFVFAESSLHAGLSAY